MGSKIFIGCFILFAQGSGTTSYFYENLNRVISKATQEGTITYTYDEAGDVKTVRSSNVNGVSNDYAYDQLNRLSTVTDNRRNTTTTYGFDSVGNLSNYNYPNGVQTNFNYDTLNRLTGMGSTNGHSISSYGYTLGAAGNRLTVAEIGTRQVVYSYDDLYRLKSETISGDTITANNGIISYQYDPVGNRLTRTSGIAAVPSTSNTFDTNDRLNTDQYNADGNTTVSNGNVYAYDFENRIIGVNNGAIVIIYDGDGNRVSKTVNGITTSYLVDTNNLTGYAQVVEELQNAVVQRVYVYGDHLISQDQTINAVWTQSFFGYDGHGSVRFLTNVAGMVTDKYDFDAFGILINRVGETPNLFLYAGEQFDPDLGFYYMRARYLIPNTGRFASADMYEGTPFDPLSLHKYLYVNSNPINMRDPSGREGTLMENLSAIAITTSLAAINAGSQLLQAFQQGGAAVGRAFQAFGQIAEDSAAEVIALFPKINVQQGYEIGNRVIDFFLRAGDRAAQLEVKYRIPSKIGEAFNRLVDQINMGVWYGEGQMVVWTYRLPSIADLKRLQDALGPDVFSQVQFVDGITGLGKWIQLYFH